LIYVNYPFEFPLWGGGPFEQGTCYTMAQCAKLASGRTATGIAETKRLAFVSAELALADTAHLSCPRRKRSGG
jgi:hypothetical protein